MEIKTIDFTTNNELSILQFETLQKNSFDYVSLSHAIDREYIIINEINESADVNNLIVTNNSDKYIFIMDGDILEGAKQNRVVNSSVLLAPNSKTILPVSCVEQGRWDYVSKNFKHTDYVAPAKIRSNKAKNVKKNLESFSGFVADQSEVWDNVNEIHEENNFCSPTSNLSDYYKISNNDLNSFIKSFVVNKKANGLALFLRNNLLSIDLFNRTDIYTEYFPKIVKAVAYEAYSLKKTDHNISKSEAYYKTQEFFDNLEKEKLNEFDGIGVGTEYRFENKGFTGLLLKYKINLIHLAALVLDKR